MSWIEPFTEWNDGYTQQPSDMNRIEGNTDYLKDAVDTEISDRASAISSEASTRAAADTILGNRITPIEAWTNQGVNTTSSPAFTALTVNGLVTFDDLRTDGELGATGTFNISGFTLAFKNGILIGFSTP